MAYDLIKISALPETTPDESQDIVIGEGDYAKRIKYADVKADMVGTSPSYTTDTEPYLTRQTAHFGVVGKCALNKLVGGSLGWNQLCNGSSVTVPSGHKYYMKKSGTASIGASTGSAITGLTSGTDMVIDLTAMFGSTIADYVYGLEQATAGAGVAWLSKYIDLSTYHAYDAGSIQSVQATAHITKDANNNVIGNNPLGSDTLRGIPQLVNNKLAFDGDEKLPDGTIKRKYKIVTFNGSENWVSDVTTAYAYRYYVSDDTVKRYTNYINHMIAANIPIIATYNPQSAVSEPLSVTAYTYTSNPNKNWVYMVASASGDIDTVAKLKTYLSAHPVTVVLPLATETIESSTSYQKIQTIDIDGTESFTTSSPVPVGHETQTADNILAALGWLGE